MHTAETQSFVGRFVHTLSEYTPWRFRIWMNRKMPHLYQYLKFGVSNANTQSHWDEAWAKHGEGARATHELPEIRKRVVAAVPAGAKVLDVGCGVGEILTILRDQKGCNCSGTDIAPSGVAAVVAKGMTGRVGVLPDIPYADSEFEVVLCTEVVEHVTDAKAAVTSLYRVTKPGGSLLLSVPDGRVDEEEFHVHRFTQESLEALVRSTGFQVLSTEWIETEVCPSFLLKAKRPS